MLWRLLGVPAAQPTRDAFVAFLIDRPFTCPSSALPFVSVFPLVPH
jgi:hypothetical protein